MNKLPKPVVALLLGTVIAAQDPTPDQPLVPASPLVSLSTWLGHKLHVREPLRGHDAESTSPTTDVLRPVAIVDDLVIDPAGRITTFVLRPLAVAAGDKVKRTALSATDVRWAATEKALVTALAPSAVAGLDEWQEPEITDSDIAASVLASQLLAVHRLSGVADDVRLPREGLWIHSGRKRVEWITIEAKSGARLVPWRACTIASAPGFLHLRDPARFADAPVLDPVDAPPSKLQQRDAAAHFATDTPPRMDPDQGRGRRDGD